MLSDTGYKIVRLCINKRQINRKVHRLLAITYINNENNYPIVDHINRNILDNRLENLRWVSHKTNCNNRPICIIIKQHGDKFIVYYNICGEKYSQSFDTYQ